MLDDRGPLPGGGHAWLFEAKYHSTVFDGAYAIEDGVVPGAFDLRVRGEPRSVERIDDPRNGFTVMPGLPDDEPELHETPGAVTFVITQYVRVDPPLSDPWWPEPLAELPWTLVYAGPDPVPDRLTFGPEDDARIQFLGAMVPCEDPGDAPRARIEVAFEGGDTAVFQVRSHGEAAIAEHAIGTVDGIPFDVGAYDHLTFAHRGPGVLQRPVLGVRLPEPAPGGECILYVEAGEPGGEPDRALWLGCDYEELRAVPVSSVQVQ